MTRSGKGLILLPYAVPEMPSTQRSEIMRSVKSRDTKPEIVVRQLLHRMGYRYRLHRPDLPGKPDIVFSSRKKVIFVHGCFWHGHTCKRGNRQPKTNTDYWRAKIERNVERFAGQLEELARKGWNALVLWECELSDESNLRVRLIQFLSEHNDQELSF